MSSRSKVRPGVGPRKERKASRPRVGAAGGERVSEKEREAEQVRARELAALRHALPCG